MKEGTTRVIDLQTDDWLAFGLFLQFSYFGIYLYDENQKEDALMVHASVYVLSEKIEALDLKTLALKTATNLCVLAGTAGEVETGLVKILQFALPETVRIIYDRTYDTNTGKFPDTKAQSSTADACSTSSILRDGFRLLLAKFAAAHVTTLRQNESFMVILEAFPAFAADIMLFILAGNALTTNGEGNLEF
ncbi:hypothetical protein H072_8134 [Dactylellina haptotyla CBS 200.50]|uniref:BTB domain-containing protein n=1 Tax=Dactylellina haptotyla (strain CBS 200.50) TaxID=1284197 RepID=S8A5Q7_DACHA|nr:hypothetical protein H072_8134 [Dactylellina haptotyla CBS 200.50]